ncbi:hypothetical protein [Deinococcus sp. 23YEL01]|uniref:hypothetical protein n=1 Tax=Deinococcus sp. 23YEL01 TaxID=2745871 RepID=UPI001E5EA8E9|nr:hypothetical protein [Deinococcus sp. 23YEL01]MCD0168070.1 hypothetical protein [Deinococcus sp. 23YEL01]
MPIPHGLPDATPHKELSKMSPYHKDFTVLSESKPIERQEFIDAFAWEDEEGSPQSPDFDGICLPEDYFLHCAAYGLAELKIAGEEWVDVLSLCDPGMARSFRLDYDYFYPSAFLIAQTEKSMFHAYTRGDQGIGLYELNIGGLEPEGRYLAASFTDLYIKGIGVDKLTEMR